MWGRADAGLRIAVFAWMGLYLGNQLLRRLGGNGWVDRDYIGRGCDQADSCEVFDVIRHLCVQARIDDKAGAYDDDRVTVRRRAQGGRQTDIAAGAGNVLDHDLLSPAFADF